MRDLHAQMLAAVLEGGGLPAIAELAAGETGGPVAIVLPARGLRAVAPESTEVEDVVAYVSARLRGRAPERPEALDEELPVVAGPEEIGSVLALRAPLVEGPGLPIDRAEVLRVAALAAVTEVAVIEARDDLAEELRGGFLEDLRRGRVEAEEVLRRGARLGCDLGRGGVALVAEVRSPKPSHAAALVSSEHRGSVVEFVDGRLYAVLAAIDGEDLESRTVTSARSIARRLRAHGPAACSSFHPEPGELHRAVAEAELVLEVISRDDRMANGLEPDLTDGVYRLLFKAMASDPDEVRRFYDETVAPLVAHDREYRTDLIGTLEAYFANDCKVQEAARAIYAHRHTVAHRLQRVRELTGLDPALSDDRERLGLGVKAYRILGPTLPR